MGKEGSKGMARVEIDDPSFEWYSKSRLEGDDV